MDKISNIYIFKGNNSVKSVGGVMVLALCLLSDNALNL